MRCSLYVQAAGPRRRRSMSLRNRSGGTRPLRRFQVRSQRTSPAASSWSQLSLSGIAAGFVAAARSPGSAGTMWCGEPAPVGAKRGAVAGLAGMDPWCPAPPVPGAALATPGAPASLRFCRTCLHIGGILWVSSPLLSERAVPICRWSFLAQGRRAGSATGIVCGAGARPGSDTSGALAASACNHSCQCVAPIWRSGLPLHRRSWKAWSQWYTVVGTAS